MIPWGHLLSFPSFTPKVSPGKTDDGGKGDFPMLYWSPNPGTCKWTPGTKPVTQQSKMRFIPLIFKLLKFQQNNLNWFSSIKVRFMNLRKMSTWNLTSSAYAFIQSRAPNSHRKGVPMNRSGMQLEKGNTGGGRCYDRPLELWLNICFVKHYYYLENQSYWSQLMVSKILLVCFTLFSYQ